MAFTTPANAEPNAVVSATHFNILRDNDNWFNALMPAPAGANLSPILTTPTTGAWSLLGSSSFGNSSIDEGVIAANAVTNEKLKAADIDTANLASPSVRYAFVPDGLIWAFGGSSANIPTGWSRFSGLNGRFPVAAGSSNGRTFVESDSYGYSWSHTHTYSIVTTATNDATTGLDWSDAVDRATSTHAHAGTGTTASTTWTVPCRAYVYIRKT